MHLGNTFLSFCDRFLCFLYRTGGVIMANFAHTYMFFRFIKPFSQTLGPANLNYQKIGGTGGSTIFNLIYSVNNV